MVESQLMVCCVLRNLANHSTFEGGGCFHFCKSIFFLNEKELIFKKVLGNCFRSKDMDLFVLSFGSGK